MAIIHKAVRAWSGFPLILLLAGAAAVGVAHGMTGRPGGGTTASAGVTAEAENQDASSQEQQQEGTATRKRRRQPPKQQPAVESDQPARQSQQAPARSQPTSQRRATTAPQGQERAAPQRQPSTQQRPPAQRRPATTQRPSTQQRPPSRSAPRPRPTPAARPAVPPMPRYSRAELKDMAVELTSLSDQLTTLGRRTTSRISTGAAADGIPIEERYRFQGEERRAKQLKRQHQDHPADLETIIALAELQRRNHKVREAEAYLLKALALEPLNQNLMFDLGFLYLENHENRKAWGTFQEIVYLNPESIEARLAQGRVRESEGTYAGAMIIYDRIEEQFGAVAGVYANRTLNLVMQGDHGAAIAMAREGLELYPDHARLYYAQGRAYEGLGLTDRAKTSFYDAISLDANLLEAYRGLGEVSLQEGNASTAVRVYLRVLDERPGDAQTSFQLGRAYLMDLRFREAIQEWELLRYLHPNFLKVNDRLPQAYYLLSLEMRDRGRFREALEAHRKAMSLSTSGSSEWMVTALLEAGGAARNHDDYPHSLQYYTLAIENDPFCAEGYIGLSRTYRAMLDLPKAAAFLEQAQDIDPDHPEVRLELTRIAQP